MEFLVFEIFRNEIRFADALDPQWLRYTRTKIKQEFLLSSKWPYNHGWSYLDTQTQRENDIWLNLICANFVALFLFETTTTKIITLLLGRKERERERREKKNVTLEIYFASRESNQTHKHTLYKRIKRKR
jgi:hypothetical protein